MRAVYILQLLTLAAAVTAKHRAPPKAKPHPEPGYDTSYKHFDCGTTIEHASEHLVNTIDSLHEEQKAGAHSAHGSPAARARRARRQGSPISVNLYMHVVTTAANQNMVNNSQMQSQLATMNSDYAPMNIQFVLRNTSWTVNDNWAVGSGSSDGQMKAALRQGTYADLNLYFQSDLAGGILGRCTLPTSIGSNPTPNTYVNDGCNIAAGTVPGGPIYGYNLGKTATHETGHWLGLLHTFEGYSCSGPGDYITDTPAESQSTNGCPTNPWKNSCAGQRSGVDPIHNYMDYSTDGCYMRFTPGQGTRMHNLWSQFRSGN